MGFVGMANAPYQRMLSEMQSGLKALAVVLEYPEIVELVHKLRVTNVDPRWMVLHRIRATRRVQLRQREVVKCSRAVSTSGVVTERARRLAEGGYNNEVSSVSMATTRLFHLIFVKQMADWRHHREVPNDLVKVRVIVRFRVLNPLIRERRRVYRVVAGVL